MVGTVCGTQRLGSRGRNVPAAQGCVTNWAPRIMARRNHGTGPKGFQKAITLNCVRNEAATLCTSACDSAGTDRALATTDHEKMLVDDTRLGGVKCYTNACMSLISGYDTAVGCVCTA